MERERGGGDRRRRIEGGGGGGAGGKQERGEKRERGGVGKKRESSSLKLFSDSLPILFQKPDTLMGVCSQFSVGWGGYSSIELEREELAGCAVYWQMLINFPVDCAFYEALT